MTETLQLLEARYRELEARCADPAVASDGQALTALMKEYKRLTPIVTTYRALAAAEAEEKEASALAKSTAEAELRAFAQTEAESAKKREIGRAHV